MKIKSLLLIFILMVNINAFEILGVIDNVLEKTGVIDRNTQVLKNADELRNVDASAYSEVFRGTILIDKNVNPPNLGFASEMEIPRVSDIIKLSTKAIKNAYEQANIPIPFVNIELQESMACGTYDTPFEAATTMYLVPDYFPSDEIISGIIGPVYSGNYDWYLAPFCGIYIDYAPFAPSCLQHDACMKARGENGKSSTQCDDEILIGWKNSCNSTYDDERDPFEIVCKQICNEVAEFSHGIMTMQTSYFTAIIGYTPVTTIFSPLLLN